MPTITFLNKVNIFLIICCFFQKRLEDAQTHGVSGHKNTKEVLRDVGQGLK